MLSIMPPKLDFYDLMKRVTVKTSHLDRSDSDVKYNAKKQEKEECDYTVLLHFDQSACIM